ncbi:hypothetical protein BDY19DRAFT_998716 [Irpex rosettiformis]|uniref:Uncharacterized protein n=1 Tax=Irpex rosettiformis TaxID=378272 RepID=A0ACB8TMM8_9APHY|nr:hypothetical protein BDY19DRAFT_998716 [Irpex rosettiformis]
MPLALQDTGQQVQDMDEEDWSSDVWEGRGLVASSPKSDSELEQGEPLSPLGYASPHPDASVPDMTVLSHALEALNATTLEHQSFHNSILRTGPRPNSWSSASTRIPPELFDNILLHLFLGYDQFGSDRGIPVCRAINACSLVRLRWANLCRRALFLGRRIKIRLSEEVQTFAKYATQGCLSLVPIHKLIESISVEQGYNMRHSFCDRVYTLKAKFGVSLYSLKLTGPVPEGFPPCKLDTPHWSLPPSVSTPPSLLSYDEIHVQNIHLPSFRHVDKYVRHFAQADIVEFKGLTWDIDGQEPQLPFYRRGSRKAKHKYLFVYAGDCTDNFLLCLLAVTVHSHWRSLMCMLPDDESERITVAIRGLQELWGKNDESCSLNIREESGELPISIISAWSGSGWISTFHFCNLAAKNAQTSDVHVVSVTLHITEAEEKINIDSLIPYLGHFPMLREVSLHFDSYQKLFTAMERSRPLSFNPRPAVGQGCLYVFMCLRQTDSEFPEVPRACDRGHDNVEIDPITLSPTGRSWVSNFDFDSSLIRESLRQTDHIPPIFT